MNPPASLLFILSSRINDVKYHPKKNRLANLHSITATGSSSSRRSSSSRGTGAINREIDSAIGTNEAALRLRNEVDAAGRVKEEAERALDIINRDAVRATLRRDELGGREEVTRVAKAGFSADLGQ